jgi:hypothetical protein
MVGLSKKNGGKMKQISVDFFTLPEGCRDCVTQKGIWNAITYNYQNVAVNNIQFGTPEYEEKKKELISHRVVLNGVPYSIVYVDGQIRQSLPKLTNYNDVGSIIAACGGIKK